jgi:hypothetical protein
MDCSMLFKEIINVYSENHIKQIYSVGKIQLLIIKVYGTHNYHWAFMDDSKIPFNISLGDNGLMMETLSRKNLIQK